MFEFQIIINGRLYSKFQAESIEKAIEIARDEASYFAEKAFRYKGAYPNSVRVEYVPTTPRYVESHIVTQNA